MNERNKKLIQKQKSSVNTNIKSNTTTTNRTTSKLTKIEYKKKDDEEDNKLEFFNVTGQRGFIKFYDVLACYPVLSIIDKLVYCTCRAYAQLSPSKNFTYVSLGRIANKLDISRTAVSRSISTLQRLGIISLYKNEKNQRFIKIEKDFEEVQEEEKEFWATHEKEFKTFNEINKLTNSNDFDDEEEEQSYEAYAFDFE